MEKLQLKIGHFGISKQIKNINENTKTQLGILSYMAPEIIKGDYYNKKADIWSLGCIIYELCTLGYCFKNNSIIELRNDINNPKPRKIDINIYGIWLQNLIDRILIKDGDKRLNIDEILRIVYNHINPLDYNKKLFLFLKNEAYQDFLIDQSILDSLDQIEINIYHRENKWAKIKEEIFEFTGFIVSWVPLIIIFFGLIPGIFSKNYLTWFINVLDKTNVFGIEAIFDYFTNKFDTTKKFILIKDNTYIINIIEERLISSIKDKLNENKIKEKIILFDQDNFNSIVQKIKNRLLLSDNKKKIAKNYNIVLLGNTNVGKSTLINEFLKLNSNEKQKKEAD